MRRTLSLSDEERLHIVQQQWSKQLHDTSVLHDLNVLRASRRICDGLDERDLE